MNTKESGKPTTETHEVPYPHGLIPSILSPRSAQYANARLSPFPDRGPENSALKLAACNKASTRQLVFLAELFVETPMLGIPNLVDAEEGHGERYSQKNFKGVAIHDTEDTGEHAD